MKGCGQEIGGNLLFKKNLSSLNDQLNKTVTIKHLCNVRIESVCLYLTVTLQSVNKLCKAIGKS